MDDPGVCQSVCHSVVLGKTGIGCPKSPPHTEGSVQPFWQAQARDTVAETCNTTLRDDASQ